MAGGALGGAGTSRSLQLAGRSQQLVATRVRRAMVAGHLVLHYQPTVDCTTGRVTSAEALVRWKHRSGLIAPGGWIAAVEATRLRTAFNLHVIKLAIAQREQLVDAGLEIPLSVNVTPACLADKSFVAELLRLFDTGAPPDAIRLEITERTTVINSDALTANVDFLARRGFQFLLDDFGAGYSSLDRLANLSVVTLKIDGALVSEIVGRESHAQIVEAVSRLAHRLGLAVVAEGVEEMAIWRRLQMHECDRVQGYLIARPMPAEELLRFVRDYEPKPPQALPAPDRRRASDRRDGRDRRFAKHRGTGVAPGLEDQA